MIARYQVEHFAQESLRSRLVTNQTALKYLTEPVKFTKWVDLLTTRCNDLQWAIKSRRSLIDFIDKATVEYARRQLDKAELKYAE